MNTFKSIVIALMMIGSLLPALAQEKRLSPHETISTVVEGDRVTVVYGRPYTKSPRTGEVRKIWGGLVPYGKVWRTGADEATLLITQKPLVFGGTTIPAGAYTLWTLPSEDGSAKLIINKQIGQWGVGRGAYNKADDVARIDLTKQTLDTPVDQFTMSVENNGTLKLAWENTSYSTTFTVAK